MSAIFHLIWQASLPERPIHPVQGCRGGMGSISAVIGWNSGQIVSQGAELVLFQTKYFCYLNLVRKPNQIEMKAIQTSANSNLLSFF